MNFYNQPIVLDNGSGNIRCGFSGDEKPRVSYSNIIGTPKYNKINYLPNSIKQNDTFVGNDAQINRGLLKLVYPIENGNIEDWNSMEIIWDKVLKHDLMKDNEINLNEHSILINDEIFTSNKQRETICQILFETFNIGAINLSISNLLSLYAMGKTTGVSVNIGDGICSIVNIFDGYILPNSLKRINLAGREITKILKTEVTKNGYLMNSSSEFEIIRNLKERLCSVNMMDNIENGSQSFPLPDGKKLNITNESLKKPCELLFNPISFGYEDNSIQELIYKSIINNDTELRFKLFNSIILSGGSTCFKNFGNRLIKEIRKIDNEIGFKIFASTERKNNCFIGGSIISSLSTFNNIVISRKEFNENPQCVYEKYY